MPATHFAVQETLRGFAVEDKLLRLPVIPHDDPESPQGLDVLMDCYIHRMEETMTKWYTNILRVDFQVGQMLTAEAWR